MVVDLQDALSPDDWLCRYQALLIFICACENYLCNTRSFVFRLMRSVQVLFWGTQSIPFFILYDATVCSVYMFWMVKLPTVFFHQLYLPIKKKNCDQVQHALILQLLIKHTSHGLDQYFSIEFLKLVLTCCYAPLNIIYLSEIQCLIISW